MNPDLLASPEFFWTFELRIAFRATPRLTPAVVHNRWQIAWQSFRHLPTCSRTLVTAEKAGFTVPVLRFSISAISFSSISSANRRMNTSFWRATTYLPPATLRPILLSRVFLVPETLLQKPAPARPRSHCVVDAQQALPKSGASVSYVISNQVHGDSQEPGLNATVSRKLCILV